MRDRSTLIAIAFSEDSVTWQLQKCNFQFFGQMFGFLKAGHNYIVPISQYQYSPEINIENS